MAKRMAPPSDPAPQRKGYRRRKAKAHDKVHARQEADVRRLEGLPVTQAHAAGVDIGSWSHWV
ncbi:MAG TPA: hypothetical protein VG013_03200, partial [Gemmataceae bacterium]|nr:hypothetical protein [Gemmataceae bacterium]